MITNNLTHHLAGIIPVAGQPLDYNMPWSDCLMPVHDGYHAVERAVHSAAMAGCNTIWVVLYRETQPIIKKKLGSWIYDPTTVWKEPYVFFNKKEIPIYYVAINPKDRKRRDSQAWSVLHGARIASYISLKISKWVLPKKFLVVSPYGVVCEETLKASRVDIRSNNNVLFTHNGKTFLDNEHLPFTFNDEQYKICKEHFKINYTGNDSRKTFKEVFAPIDIINYNKLNANWYYDLTNWRNYSAFIGSEHNRLCERPKYMVTHKWHGFINDR